MKYDCEISDDLVCILCGKPASRKHVRRNCPAKPIPQEIIAQAAKQQAEGQPPQRAIPPLAVGGPGTELKRLLKSWLNIEPTESCACNSMSARMDSLGPEWCESDAGMAEIVGTMRSEAARRGLPFIDAGGRLLVRRAIKNARRTAINAN